MTRRFENEERIFARYREEALHIQPDESLIDRSFEAIVAQAGFGEGAEKPASVTRTASKPRKRVPMLAKVALLAVACLLVAAVGIYVSGEGSENAGNQPSSLLQPAAAFASEATIGQGAYLLIPGEDAAYCYFDLVVPHEAGSESFSVMIEGEGVLIAPELSEEWEPLLRLDAEEAVHCEIRVKVQGGLAEAQQSASSGDALQWLVYLRALEQLGDSSLTVSDVSAGRTSTYFFVPPECSVWEDVESAFVRDYSLHVGLTEDPA